MADAFVEAGLDSRDVGAWFVTLSNGASSVARLRPRPGEHVGSGRPRDARRSPPLGHRGARRAGLRTAWINHDGVVCPDHLDAAEIGATSFLDLAERLGAPQA